eukprot:XP_028342864.1 uncharacterized protein LOC114485511 [Physeter catodon]
MSRSGWQAWPSSLGASAWAAPAPRPCGQQWAPRREWTGPSPGEPVAQAGPAWPHCCLLHLLRVGWPHPQSLHLPCAAATFFPHWIPSQAFFIYSGGDSFIGYSQSSVFSRSRSMWCPQTLTRRSRETPGCFLPASGHGDFPDESTQKDHLVNRHRRRLVKHRPGRQRCPSAWTELARHTGSSAGHVPASRAQDSGCEEPSAGGQGSRRITTDSTRADGTAAPKGREEGSLAGKQKREGGARGRCPAHVHPRTASKAPRAWTAVGRAGLREQAASRRQAPRISGGTVSASPPAPGWSCHPLSGGS